MEGLQQRVKLRPIFDGTGAVVLGKCLFTTYNGNIVQTNTETMRIEKEIAMPSNIACICAVSGVLAIATVGGIFYTYSTEKQTVEYLAKENIVAKEMAEHNGHLAVGTAEGSILLIDLAQKAVIFRKALKGSITQIESKKTSETKRAYKSGRSLLVAGDILGNVFMLDTDAEKVFYTDSTHTAAVTFIETIEETTYTGGADGCIIAHRNGREHKIREVGYAIASGAQHNGSLFVAGSGSCIERYSADLKKTKADALALPPLSEIRAEENRLFLVTEEGDIALGRIEEDTPTVCQTIVGDNDEITDLLALDKHIVVSTNSSMLRVIERRKIAGAGEGAGEEEQEGIFACAAEMLTAPNEECSLSLAGNSKMFFNGTKDGYINGFSYIPCTPSGAPLLFASTQTAAPVTSLHLHKNILLSGFENGAVMGWEVGSALSLLFTAVVSASEITGIAVIGNVILAACKDKELKRIDFTGRVLGGIEGHKKGIWSVHSSQDALITGSTDKTARVWKEGQTQHILQHNFSVIKTLLTDRAITATSEGVVRVWNAEKEKELAACRLSETKEDRIWSIKELSAHLYLVSAGGALFILQDNTKEMERQREEEKRTAYLIKQKGDALMHAHQYTEAAAAYFHLSSHKELKEALRKIDTRASIAPLVAAMSTNKEKALVCLAKWARSPQLFCTTERLLKTVLDLEWAIPEKTTEELSAILLRSSSILDSAY